MSEFPTRPTLNRRYRMQWEEVQGCYVLLYPEGMVKLNASASAILKRCDGSRDVATIIAEIEEEFSTEGLTADIKGMLRLAFERNWIQ
jgi:pyrroloquinoline quinone biosynthesis protein D